MAGETDSAALLGALLAELDDRAGEASACADELAAAAADLGRWGLAHEAEGLRRSARRHRVSALLHDGRAEAWRSRFADLGRTRS